MSDKMSFFAYYSKINKIVKSLLSVYYRTSQIAMRNKTSMCKFNRFERDYSNFFSYIINDIWTIKVYEASVICGDY